MDASCRLAQFVINKSSNQSRSKNAADLDCHHFVRRCAVLRRCSGKEHYKWTSHNHSSFCNIKQDLRETLTMIDSLTAAQKLCSICWLTKLIQMSGAKTRDCTKSRILGQKPRAIFMHVERL
ncbi:unnamed protein product [Cylicocyclus nassatus]|uniref:Uncharacterized protein n=1 Tax=Cylicocyclus nassatus TaxID=53992 RepID=A0AA36HG27_CYLNA|nr:unnamed protein product [Cylicocyclus nassatus]